MQHPVDLVLYIAIASFALLPAVYAVALDATRRHTASLRMKESILTAEYLELLEGAKATEGEPTDDEALLSLQQALRSYEKRLSEVRGPAVHLAPRRALLLPAAMWALCIVLGAFARFLPNGGGVVGTPLFLASLGLLIAGYRQTIVTLTTAHRAIEESLPKLKVTVDGPFETRESQRGEAQYTLQYNIAVLNDSTQTARGVQVIVGVPSEGLYFPVLRPMTVTRGGREVRVGFTPQFDLKPQDTYKQFLMLRPSRVGYHRLTFTPICEDWIGASRTVTLSADRTS